MTNTEALYLSDTYVNSLNLSELNAPEEFLYRIQN